MYNLIEILGSFVQYSIIHMFNIKQFYFAYEELLNLMI